MTGEEMERAIEFLVKQQAQLTADVEGLKEAVSGLTKTVEGLTQVQAATSQDVMALAGMVGELARMAEEDRRRMREGFAALEAQADADRQEIRAAIGGLITANEVTRNLTEQIGMLVKSHHQRLGDLESRLP